MKHQHYSSYYPYIEMHSCSLFKTVIKANHRVVLPHQKQLCNLHTENWTEEVIISDWASQSKHLTFQPYLLTHAILHTNTHTRILHFFLYTVIYRNAPLLSTPKLQNRWRKALGSTPKAKDALIWSYRSKCLKVGQPLHQLMLKAYA